MKTMGQSTGKMITSIVVLLISLSLHPSTTSAKAPTDTSVCSYRETRKNIPINPKTNKPYKPEERDQEPFAKASISKQQIKQCLQAEESITNHHILYEDYRDAWQELAKKTRQYSISLLIEGGVLHTHRGPIGLWEFRDPTIITASQLMEEEQKTFGITKKEVPVVLIRSNIGWTSVFMDSVVMSTHQRNTSTIFSNEVNFSFTIFNNGADFGFTIFNNGADFSSAIFNGRA